MDQNEEMMEFETLMLPLEDGTEKEYAILESFQVNGKGYMVLAEILDDDVSEVTEIYRYTEDGDEISVEYIEDDAEFETVMAAYEKMLAEDNSQ